MAYGKKFQESRAENLKDPDIAMEYLQDALEDPSGEGDDIGHLMCAIGDVAKAHGIENVMEKTNLSRASATGGNEVSLSSFRREFRFIAVIRKRPPPPIFL